MIEISPITPRDLPRLAGLWSRALARLGLPCPLDASDVEEHVLLHGGEPRAILAIDPGGWLAAREDDVLVGFAHATVGRLESDDPEMLRGVLRALVVAEDAANGVVDGLLQAVNAYFQQKRHLQDVIAFALETGYPRVAYGRGALLGDDWRLMEALGARGYRLERRWLFYERTFEEWTPEHLPQAGGLLLQRESLVPAYWRWLVQAGVQTVAEARFMVFDHPGGCAAPRSASLYHLTVDPGFQRRGIGRWLLERGANHLRARGVTRLFVDIPHEDAINQARLMRLGFRELPLRGYSYRKS